MTFDENEYKTRGHISHARWLGSDTKYKHQAIKAAKDLGYGQNVISKLVKAESDGQVERIMIAAREGKFDER